MSFLSNCKIRTKILVALLPLLVMMLGAGLYSSMEMKKIDARYSEMIDNTVSARQALGLARADNNRFGLYLYKEIADTDSDQSHMADAELEAAVASFRTAADEAKHKDPSLAEAVDQARESFDRMVTDVSPVRAAALAGDKQKAARITQDVVDPAWLRTRELLMHLESAVEKQVNAESDQLTDRTHRTIIITWVVTGAGLLLSLAIALAIVQFEVVGGSCLSGT